MKRKVKDEGLVVLLRARFAILALLLMAPGLVLAQPAGSRQLQLFSDWLSGEFNNNEQVWQQAVDGVPEQARHKHLHYQFVPAHTPNVGENTFFVKEYKDGDYENIHRLQLYRLTWDEDEQLIRQAVFSFVDEEQYRDGARGVDALVDVRLEALRNKPACDVLWTHRGDHFIGQVKAGGCSLLHEETGTPRSGTTLTLNREMIRIDEKIFDEEGGRVSGRDNAYTGRTNIGRKVRYFSGWAVIRADRIGLGDEENKDKMIFISGLRIHNEGQQLPLVTKDGVDTGYAIELARLTYQATRIPVLVLGLIEQATGKTFSYVWTNPGANRIGVNLRWLQVGLTAEDMIRQ